MGAISALPGQLQAHGSVGPRMNYKVFISLWAFVSGYKFGFNRLRPVKRKFHRKLPPSVPGISEAAVLIQM